jgi:DNA repair photolyase
MIISASRRTDIPAFYGKWFMDKVRKGFCVVRNPFNPQQKYHVPLNPEEAEVLVFWTRYARPFLKYLDELDQRGYRYYFLFTLTEYGYTLEPHLPPYSSRLRSFRQLSDRLDPSRVVWRYDPILIGPEYSYEFHLRQFSQIARDLKGYADTVIISFVDFYAKTCRNLSKAGVQFERHPERRGDRFIAFLRELAEIARSSGFHIQSCGESRDLSHAGVVPGKCIDDARILRAFGLRVPERKDPSQRKTCRCIRSRDIGAYNTCLYGCLYCYATSNSDCAKTFFKTFSYKEDSLNRYTPDMRR